MSMEIGSDFAFLPLEHWAHPREWGVFCQSLDRARVLTDSGRTALRLGIRHLGLQPCDSLLVPAYICHSVLGAVRGEGIVPLFYGIAGDFHLEIDRLSCFDCDAILLVDFFGINSAQNEVLSDNLVLRGYRVLHDISHSLLAPLQRVPKERHSYVASIRKTLPLSDGGLLLALADLSSIADSLVKADAPHATRRATAMMIKSIWLARLSGVKLPFRELFLESESMLDADGQCYSISAMSAVLVSCINAESTAYARRQNYQSLLANAADWPMSVKPVFEHLPAGDVPLGFPIFCSERDSLQRFLIENRVYPPIHWPLSPEITIRHPESEHISRHILTIPCDQRYTADDMQYISKLIGEWLHG